MMDWGGWVIVASVVLTPGKMVNYRPSTLFDQAACMRTAQTINAEWQRDAIVGFATCRRAQDE